MQRTAAVGDGAGRWANSLIQLIQVRLHRGSLPINHFPHNASLSAPAAPPRLRMVLMKENM